jgi:hypothetical protein
MTYFFYHGNEEQIKKAEKNYGNGVSGWHWLMYMRMITVGRYRSRSTTAGRIRRDRCWWNVKLGMSTMCRKQQWCPQVYWTWERPEEKRCSWPPIMCQVYKHFYAVFHSSYLIVGEEASAGEKSNWGLKTICRKQQSILFNVTMNEIHNKNQCFWITKNVYNPNF